MQPIHGLLVCQEALAPRAPIEPAAPRPAASEPQGQVFGASGSRKAFFRVATLTPARSRFPAGLGSAAFPEPSIEEIFSHDFGTYAPTFSFLAP